MRRTYSFKGVMQALFCVSVLILLIGVFLLSYQQKKAFLQNHLSITAQDTATSLALALSTAASSSDWVLASGMMDAIFDSGAYAVMQLSDLEGKPVFERRASQALEGVPSWFRQWVDLNPGAGKAAVLSGWRETAALRVEANVGPAYRALWNELWNLLLWFAFVSLIVWLLMRLLLHRVLSPLRQLVLASKRVEDQDFRIRLKAGRIAELNVLASAHNRMSESLKRHWLKQEQEVECLRQEHWQDPLTALDNRQGFDRRLEAWLSDTESCAEGVLLLIHLSGLASLNRDRGREAGDQLLKETAELLRDEVRGLDGVIYLGRREGARFAVFVSATDRQSVKTWAERVHRRVADWVVSDVGEPAGRVDIGGCQVTVADSLLPVLCRADQALRASQASSGSTVSWLDASAPIQPPDLTASQWQKLLQNALRESDFECYIQPMQSADGEHLVYHQISLRLPYQGRPLPPSMFFPRIFQQGLALSLDCWVVRAVLSESLLLDGPACVALSLESLQDDRFFLDMNATLQGFPKKAGSLLLSVPEHCLSQAVCGMDALLRLREEWGFRIVVSHFGAGPRPFAALESWPVDSVRLDLAVLTGIPTNKSQARYVRGMIDILHARGLRVMATGVEDEVMSDYLKDAGIDGMMGYWFQRPFLLKRESVGQR